MSVGTDAATRLTINADGALTLDGDAANSWMQFKDAGTLSGYIGGGIGLSASPNNLNTDLTVRAKTKLVFCTDNAAAAKMVIDSAGNVSVGAESFTPHADADDFVIKPAVTSTGITIRCNGDGGTGSIFFADTSSNAVGQIRYNHNTDNMAISAADEINFTCDLATFANDVKVGTDANYVLEGYATGRNVLRSIRLNILPGDTPGTNINVSHDATAGRSFNSPSLTSGTNIANDASGGSFALGLSGTRITVDINNVVGMISETIIGQDLNSSSTSEVYFPNTVVVSSDLSIAIQKAGSTALVDWRTILDAGDSVTLMIAYVSSS